MARTGRDSVRCPTCGAANQPGADRCRICATMLVRIPTPSGAAESGGSPDPGAGSGWSPPPPPPVDEPVAPSPGGAPAPTPAASENRDPVTGCLVAAFLVVAAAVALTAGLGLASGEGALANPITSVRRLLGLEFPEAEWRTFEDPGKRFVVELPGDPSHYRDSEVVEDVRITYISWTTEVETEDLDRLAASVGVILLPPELRGFDADALLTAAVDEVRAEPDTAIAESRFLWTDWGRALDVVATEGGTFFRGRLIHAGNAVYVVETEAEGPHEQYATRVIDSFRITAGGESAEEAVD